MNSEKIIDVRDLLAEIVRRLVIIILCAVVLAAVFGGYKYLQDKKAQSAVIVEETTEQKAQKLSGEELSEVTGCLALYQDLQEMSTMMAENCLFTLNYQSVDQVNQQYWIQTENADDLVYLYNIYCNYINDGDLAADVSDATGYEYNKIDSCFFADNSDYSASSALSVTVYGQDEETCRTLATAAGNCLATFANTLNGYDAHTLNLLDENYKKGYSNQIYQAQNVLIINYNTKKASYDSQVDKLSDAQLSYLNSLKSMDDADMTAGSETVAATAPSEPVPVTISKKYLGLGALIGFVIGLILIIAGYIFRSSLKTPDELYRLYGIYNLGNYRVKKWGLFKKLSEAIFYRHYPGRGEDPALLASRIRTICRTHGFSALTIAGVSDDTYEFCQQLKNSLDADGITCKIMSSLLDDVRGLSELGEKEQVILLGRINKSSVMALSREICFAQQQKYMIFGYVTID